MTDEYIICEGCKKRIRPLRRYPLEPLAKWFGLSLGQTCRLTRMAGTTEKEARCHGITRKVVDRICDEFKAHPSEIWPEVVDHDIEDLKRPCDYCGKMYLPPRSARFCSKRCRSRAAQGRQNNQRRARYANDPAYRERLQAEARAYYWEHSRSRRIKRKLWRESNPEHVREMDRRYRERNREELNARQRERYHQGKGMGA